MASAVQGLGRLGVGLLAVIKAPIRLAAVVGVAIARLARAIAAAPVVLLQALKRAAGVPIRGLRAAWFAAGGAFRDGAEGIARLPRAAQAVAGAWMRSRPTTARAELRAPKVTPPEKAGAARPEAAGRTRPRVEQPPKARPSVSVKAPALPRPTLPSLPRLKAPTLRLPRPKLPSHRTRPADSPIAAAATTPATAVPLPAMATVASIPWLAKPIPPAPAPVPEGAKSPTPRAGLTALAGALDGRSPAHQRVIVFGTMVAFVVLLGVGSIGVARIAFGSGSGDGHNGNGRPSEPLGGGSGILSFMGIVPSPSPAASPGSSPTPSNSSAPGPPAPSNRPQQPRPSPTPSPTPTAQQPPSATLSTLAASPTSLVADGASSSTVVVTLKDSTGNAVRGDHVTLTSSRGTNDTIAPLSPGTDNSDSNGMARFKVTSTKAGSATLTAKDTTVSPNVTLSQTASLTFTAGPTSASTSTVGAAPTSLAADGAAASSVTVTVKDAFGNGIAGHQVNLVSSRGAQDVVTVVSGTTDATGVASFKVSSVNAGAAVLTATDTTAAVVLTATPTITFTQAASATLSTVSVDVPSVPPDGATPATITVTIKDYAGASIAGHTVTVTSSAGAQDTIAAVSGTTDASGAATFQIVSSTAGTSTLTATDVTANVTVTQTATVTFA